MPRTQVAHNHKRLTMQLFLRGFWHTWLQTPLFLQGFLISRVKDGQTHQQFQLRGQYDTRYRPSRPPQGVFII